MVGEPNSNLPLVETKGILRVSYIALRHCWGVVLEDLKFCTYRRNIEEQKISFDFNKLPKTFQEAVMITRALGIQYLWIDSLCIMHKDKDEWIIAADSTLHLCKSVDNFYYDVQQASLSKCGSIAEFRGDSGFPNSALRYFRSGRIILFQTLYGLERGPARTFETEGDYGILKR
ncbi:hypothetical protein DL769_002071 [Monosporascus sp. CRB-8-3]|nr:hypothetical protein DL769_002071 [Monosporascus sp. CRB-8-3]